MKGSDFKDSFDDNNGQAFDNLSNLKGSIANHRMELMSFGLPGIYETMANTNDASIGNQLGQIAFNRLLNSDNLTFHGSELGGKGPKIKISTPHHLLQTQNSNSEDIESAFELLSRINIVSRVSSEKISRNLLEEVKREALARIPSYHNLDTHNGKGDRSRKNSCQLSAGSDEALSPQVPDLGNDDDGLTANFGNYSKLQSRKQEANSTDSQNDDFGWMPRGSVAPRKSNFDKSIKVEKVSFFANASKAKTQPSENHDFPVSLEPIFPRKRMSPCAQPKTVQFKLFTKNIDRVKTVTDLNNGSGEKKEFDDVKKRSRELSLSSPDLTHQILATEDEAKTRSLHRGVQNRSISKIIEVVEENRPPRRKDGHIPNPFVWEDNDKSTFSEFSDIKAGRISPRHTDVGSPERTQDVKKGQFSLGVLKLKGSESNESVKGEKKQISPLSPKVFKLPSSPWPFVLMGIAVLLLVLELCFNLNTNSSQ